MTTYKGMKVVVSGAFGFLGRVLSKELEARGANVGRVTGDLRNPATISMLDPSVDMFFHFGSPSSQVLFKRNLSYCVDATINGFLNVSRACRANGVKLVYPSTGVLSLNGEINEYATAKSICEKMHLQENMNALGLRIFATYGPQEGHKGDFASVPYLFAKNMVQGKRPVIFGDGEQTRDFIYVDDVVNSILEMAQEQTGIIDIGSGQSTSFNELVSNINAVLKTDLSPVYVDKPHGYVENTASNKKSHEIYTPKVSLKEVIRRTIKKIEEIYETSDLHDHNQSPDKGTAQVHPNSKK